jgi:hypothetical protein
MRRLAKIVPILAVFGTVTALAAPDSGPSTAPTPGSGSNAPVMSVGEMNVAAASLEARLEDDTQQVLHLQEVAKKAKDVIKLNCVNDRLVQIKAQRNIADETRNQLTAALSKNSDDRQGLYVQLSGVAEQVKDLREQAKACIGEPELYKQESGVTVDHPPFPDDPTVTSPTIEGVEAPGYASPYD